MSRVIKAIAIIAMVATVGALGFYLGYRTGRSTLPTIIERGAVREIISNPRANVTDSTTTISVGSSHGRSYSVIAFSMVQSQLNSILESIPGVKKGNYFTYLLPEPGGFRIEIQHDNLTEELTQAQTTELTERVETALREETIRWESEE